MTGCVWLDARGQRVQLLHVFVVTVRVELYHFHRFQLFQFGFLGDLVFSLIRIIHEVTHVSDVADVSYPVSHEFKITE